MARLVAKSTGRPGRTKCSPWSPIQPPIPDGSTRRPRVLPPDDGFCQTGKREAYLAAHTHKGTEAAAEFQKIIDHRGIVLNGPIAALARLGLARAFAQEGDAAK
jgi:hypothetical protein